MRRRSRETRTVGAQPHRTYLTTGYGPDQGAAKRPRLRPEPEAEDKNPAGVGSCQRLRELTPLAEPQLQAGLTHVRLHEFYTRRPTRWRSGGPRASAAAIRPDSGPRAGTASYLLRRMSSTPWAYTMTLRWSEGLRSRDPLQRSSHFLRRMSSTPWAYTMTLRWSEGLRSRDPLQRSAGPRAGTASYLLSPKPNQVRPGATEGWSDGGCPRAVRTARAGVHARHDALRPTNAGRRTVCLSTDSPHRGAPLRCTSPSPDRSPHRGAPLRRTSPSLDCSLAPDAPRESLAPPRCDARARRGPRRTQ